VHFFVLCLTYEGCTQTPKLKDWEVRILKSFGTASTRVVTGKPQIQEKWLFASPPPQAHYLPKPNHHTVLADQRSGVVIYLASLLTSHILDCESQTVETVVWSFACMTAC
jgi:hypothetical protein